MALCGVCEKRVEDEVSCSICREELHHTCSNVTARTWKSMAQKRKEAWKCEKCKIKVLRENKEGKESLMVNTDDKGKKQ